MKHMCMMEAEHARTSQVTYTLHQITPKGQYPEMKSGRLREEKTTLI